MNTLMGVKGHDFVLLGGDSAFFRSVVIMDTVSASASWLSRQQVHQISTASATTAAVATYRSPVVGYRTLELCILDTSRGRASSRLS